MTNKPEAPENSGQESDESLVTDAASEQDDKAEDDESEVDSELMDMQYALAAALESHSKIEDELLFQVLEPFFPSGQGPLAAMRAEHDEIDGSMERVLASTDLEERRALLKRISELAREHFAKEEQVLFPMAEQRLGVARLEEIGERWAEERNVVLGTPIPFGGPVA